MPHTFVIFGASGDLTSRKLIPALYNLRRKKRLPDDTRVVGFSRTAYSHEDWRKELAESTAKFVGENFDAELWNEFSQQIFYHPGDIGVADDFAKLKGFLEEIEGGGEATRVYYLSTAPRFYEQAIGQLGDAGLACEDDDCKRRVVIEKPFGTDLASAVALNEAVHKSFAEHQVYRIDHYLGKETVQNLL
ncbi:MAG: glucose-6-phosphate dehydrogenase, partial [Planctomycetales bacterium]|nr:glucose-6-phosphate dehydrogenase [Planctomycetales bacterium]